MMLIQTTQLTVDSLMASPKISETNGDMTMTFLLDVKLRQKALSQKKVLLHLTGL